MALCQPTMTKVYVTGTVGFILLLIGCILIPVGQFLVRHFVEQDVILVQGSTAYETWLTPPTPIYMQFWAWDLTNPQEFLAGGVPHLVEKGPYTYEEFREKEELTYNRNYTVSYKPKTTYIFRRDLSVGPDTDTFTTINLPAMTLANAFQYDPTLEAFQYLLNQLSGATTLITIPIGGFVWGYEDAYLKYFKTLDPFLNISTEFGIFLGTNATAGKLHTISTGEDDTSKVGEVEFWDGKSSLEWWSDKYSNMINGTDGTMFRPFLSPSDQLYVFVDVLCRAGFLQYAHSGSIRGIPVSRFIIPPELYANVSYYPDNLGFCTPPGNLPCVPNGLLNVSECQPGKAPVYFSSPHFLYGDPSLFAAVSGMSPNEDIHGTFFDIDLLTGITFQVHNRLQINVKVGPMLQFEDARMVKEAYVPMVWLNETSQVDQYNADFYISESLVPQYVLIGIIAGLISIGGGLFIGSLLTCLILRHRSKIDAKVQVDEDTKEEKKL